MAWKEGLALASIHNLFSVLRQVTGGAADHGLFNYDVGC